MQIALGAAKGVSHIHEEGGDKFTHGNIKLSNILLTGDLGACVSDFGLVPLFSSAAATNLIADNRAPEVVETRKVTQQSDVYSFGVLLLEMLTGKAPNLASLSDEGIDLPRWVQSVVREEWAAEVFVGLGVLDDDQGGRRLEDEFSPSILAEKYMTAKDDEIHKIDVDGFQLFGEITGPVPHNEKGLLSRLNLMDKSLEVLRLFFAIGHESATKFLGGQQELRIEALVDVRAIGCQVLEDIAENFRDTSGVWYIWQDWSTANRSVMQEDQKHLKRELLMAQDQIIAKEMVQMQQIVDSDLPWRRLIRSVCEQYLAKLKTFSLTTM